MAAWKKRVPAANKAYQVSARGYHAAKAALVAEQKSPAISPSLMTNLIRRAAVAAQRAEASAKRIRYSRQRRAAMGRLGRMILPRLPTGGHIGRYVRSAPFNAELNRLKAPYIAAENRRVAGRRRGLSAAQARSRASASALTLAQSEDRAAAGRAAVAAQAQAARAARAAQAQAARAAQAAKTARDRALMRARSKRLAARIAANAKAATLNSKRMTNATTLITANRKRTMRPVARVQAAKAAASVARRVPVLSNAEKAAIQTEKRLAKKSQKIAVNSQALAIIDAKKTAQAEVIRAKIFNTNKPKSPIVPVLAGAALGFKVMGIQGAAVGAVAGFMTNKGGA